MLQISPIFLRHELFEVFIQNRSTHSAFFPTVADHYRLSRSSIKFGN